MEKIEHTKHLMFCETNNEAEDNALLIELRVAKAIEVQDVEYL